MLGSASHDAPTEGAVLVERRETQFQRVVNRSAQSAVECDATMLSRLSRSLHPRRQVGTAGSLESHRLGAEGNFFHLDVWAKTSLRRSGQNSSAAL
jgi:hypothetical protein